jgi:hypothetical protein
MFTLSKHVSDTLQVLMVLTYDLQGALTPTRFPRQPSRTAFILPFRIFVTFSCFFPVLSFPLLCLLGWPCLSFPYFGDSGTKNKEMNIKYI